MAESDKESLEKELKKKQICRFCLSQDTTSLTNIFYRDTRIKSSAPLPIQIMAIASIEIFSNDGMPPYVCNDCVSIFEYSYQFKQMCKKADNLLRQFPLVGTWPKSLEKPNMPQTLQTLQTMSNSKQPLGKKVKENTNQESFLLTKPKKILNVHAKAKNNNVTNSTKVEKVDDECGITYLEKIDNNDELSIDDIQLLVASEDVAEAESVKTENLAVVTKPKLLNKSSVRILNKDASRENEPRLSLPKIKKGDDGNMEIVAEILNIDDKYEEEPDPKNAEPIETNIYPCSYCERTFPLVQLRDIHLRKHLRDRNYPCNDCDKSFFSKYDLQRHLFIHSGERPFKCSACNQAFSRSNLLTRHEKTHTDIPKHICIHCERAFLSKEDMEKHAERHKIVRPFQCKICFKSFAFKQGVERHEIKHSRQQPFNCLYCDQSFSTTTKLARHLTAHAGLRPFPCKYCKKSYLLSHHLTRHLRSHRNVNDNTNVVDFMCTTCKTSFDSRDKLIQHSKTHADEQNLTCPLCKEVFDNMNMLTAHIQDHSEGEAYACEFCDLIFITAEKLQLHTDQDHVQEMKAYHADDRAQAKKKMKENSAKVDTDVSDEHLQSTVNAFLMDELSDDGSASNNQLKIKIKTEKETSPKIMNQIIIQSATQETKLNEVENQVDNNNSLMIPLKQLKVDVAGNKIVTAEAKSVQQNKQPQQLKRKGANAATPTRDVNQPTIQSLLKISAKRSSPPEKKTLSVKIKKDESPSFPKTSESQNEEKTIEKRVKVKKIRVTKAEAAAMARDGHIKIKDGKIILKTEALTKP